MVYAPIGYPIRVGIIKNVSRTSIEFEFLDRLDDQTFSAPSPQPYAGRGGGILAGIEKDSIILVANGPGEKWYCLAVVPDGHSFQKHSGADRPGYSIDGGDPDPLDYVSGQGTGRPWTANCRRLHRRC